jgi:hypothetical protein
MALQDARKRREEVLYMGRIVNGEQTATTAATAVATVATLSPTTWNPPLVTSKNPPLATWLAKKASSTHSIGRC